LIAEQLAARIALQPALVSCFHHASNTRTHPQPIDRRAAIEKLRGQNARLKEELLLENKFSV